MKFLQPDAASALLSSLIGNDVTVTSGPSPAGGSAPFQVWYLDDDDVPVCSAIADLSLAHGGGAAIAMIPAGRAQDATKAGTPDKDLLVNFREVLNVLARPLNETNGFHVRMDPPAAAAPRDVALGAAAHYQVSIAGYGAGVLTLAEVA